MKRGEEGMEGEKERKAKKKCNTQRMIVFCFVLFAI